MIINNKKIQLLFLASMYSTMAGCAVHPSAPEPPKIIPLADQATDFPSDIIDSDTSNLLSHAPDPALNSATFQHLKKNLADILKDNLQIQHDVPLLVAENRHAQQLHIPLLPAKPGASAVSDDIKPALEEMNIWQRIRQNYDITDHKHIRIDKERDWYVKHPSYIDRTVDRARPYIYLIAEALEARNMPMEIVLLPIVESAYQPFAYSHGRAAGIWQFIPGTARAYGLKQNWWYDGRRDIEASTRAALDYLQYLHKTFQGDWLLALAAYNSGSGTVKSAINYNRKRGRPTDFWSLRLPQETKSYVPKLLALSNIFAEPKKYDIKLATISNEPFLEKVAIGSQIDLALAAELAELTIDEIYLYNPGFNRWATDPDGPHSLLLPVSMTSTFQHNLGEVPPERRITWVRHRIREGETLGHIANRYDTTITVLRKVNNINGHMIRAGKSMLIPVAAKNLDAYKLSQAQRKKATQNSRNKGVKIVHQVKSGDTLWDLSRKYHVGTRQLAKWNAMAPRDILKPGQKLVIWKTTAGSTANSQTSGMAPNLSAATQRILYVVRKGDSLSRISQKFNVTVSDLRNWNALPKGKYLQPGQKLTLYVNVIRQTESG